MSYERSTALMALSVPISAGLFAALNAHLAVALAFKAADAGAALAGAAMAAPPGAVLLLASCAATSVLILWPNRT